MDLIELHKSTLKDLKKLSSLIKKRKKEREELELEYEKERNRVLDNNKKVQDIRRIYKEICKYDDSKFKRKIKEMWRTATQGMGKRSPVSAISLSEVNGKVVISHRGIGWMPSYRLVGKFSDVPLKHIAAVIKNKEEVRKHIKPSYREIFDNLMKALESTGADLSNMNSIDKDALEAPLDGVDQIVTQEWSDYKEEILTRKYESPFTLKYDGIYSYKEGKDYSDNVIYIGSDNGNLVHILPFMDIVLKAYKELKNMFEESTKSWFDVIDALKGFTIVSDITDTL